MDHSSRSSWSPAVALALLAAAGSLACKPEAVTAAPQTEEGPPSPTAASGLPSPVHPQVSSECGNDGGVGTALKPFALPTLEGQRVGDGDYRGRVLLLNFWGTWCKPCLEELPEFDRLYRHYGPHGLALVAIATDTEPGPVQDFVRSRKLAASVLLEGEPYASQYESPNFPFTFVVDPSGTIVGSYRGFKKECLGKLEADLRRQLEQQADGG